MYNFRNTSKPALIVNLPSSTTINTQHRIRKKSPPKAECKIDLLKLDRDLLKKLDLFLTSYQSFALMSLSKQLSFMTMTEIKPLTSHIYRINANESECDDDKEFYRIGRFLHIMQTKQSQLISLLTKSRTKKFCPRTLVIKECQMSWETVKKIGMNVQEIILDNSTIINIPPVTQLLAFFNRAHTISMPTQRIENSRLWLNDIVQWQNSQPVANIELCVTGLEFIFSPEKLYRFFRSRTKCVIKVTIVVKDYSELLRLRQTIDENISQRFLQVFYQQQPIHFFKIILQTGNISEELQFVPRVC